MIKINLLGDQDSADDSKKLQVISYVASLVASLGLCFIIRSMVSGNIEELKEKRAKLKVDLQKVQKTTAEVREYESKREDYNNKLAVIALLKKNKAGPVRVMDDLNNALPEKAWLTEVKEDAGVFRVTGKAIDNQTFSSLIRGFGSSDYFGEPKNEIVKLGDHEQVKIREFSFDVDVKYSGKVAQQEADKDQKDQAAETEKKAELYFDKNLIVQQDDLFAERSYAYFLSNNYRH